ncbi:hypothetical protein Glove_692g20 [Diversispora epigaea]|uniref:Uncharacterized protein n=1 Tax=Diversispora epigaea TaxID=1348612 RepID=A0A397G212_9GLOM|nr:hypothetical protein Glove_692g20 [Diversispora epigaea]
MFGNRLRIITASSTQKLHFKTKLSQDSSKATQALYTANKIVNIFQTAPLTSKEF